MSSCEAELEDLMHQIDIMVNQKKSEWENQEQTLLARLHVREQELVNIQLSLDKKHQEVGRLKQELDYVEISKQKMTENYEEQIERFKCEVSEEALDELQNLHSIVIKQADKGGKIVLMDKDLYVNQMNVLLLDNLIYRPLTKAAKPLIPRIYGLPKIHKHTTAQLMRPIVSGAGLCTEPLSIYVEGILHEFLNSCHTILRDTNMFLQRLYDRMETIDNDEAFVFLTMDIESLFTSIPNVWGIDKLSKLKAGYEKLQKHNMKRVIKRNSRSADGEKITSEINQVNRKLQQVLHTYQGQIASKMQPHVKDWPPTKTGSEHQRNTLENSIEVLKGSEAIITHLKATREDLSQLCKQNYQLLQELSTTQRQCKNLELELSEQKIELQSRDDLLKVTEQEHAELRNQIAKMKAASTEQECALRLQEQESEKVMARELANLKMELESTTCCLKESRRNEMLLKTEITKLQEGLRSSQSQCEQLNEDLTKRNMEWQSAKQKQKEQLTELSKVREQLKQLEQSHGSEMERMRIKVCDLTMDLQKKDASIETLTEKVKYMQKEQSVQLKEMSTQLGEYQTGSSTLQVLQNTAVSNYKLQLEEIKLKNEVTHLQTQAETFSPTSQEKYETALRNTNQFATMIKEHESSDFPCKTNINIQDKKDAKKMSPFVSLQVIPLYSGTDSGSGHRLTNTMSSSSSSSTDSGKNISPMVSSQYIFRNFFFFFSMSTELLLQFFLLLLASSKARLCQHHGVKGYGLTSFAASAVQIFFHEEEERALQLEKMLDSHIFELQKHLDKTVNKYTQANLKNNSLGASSLTSEDKFS
ncbi:deuterosome assembly protein 1 [Protopterus annectens]|uniref:deuterosome assembly protein 1 n=1 Tax=Protopterus annectens TaxID=7888 RepID=UPI001CF99CA2|nr:deuterosome assembly protein 1 [Protopterus annectens]